MKNRREETCKYCGLDIPEDGELYFLFRDMEQDNKDDIVLCPDCISTMVSTYQFGHRYKLVGVLKSNIDASNEVRQRFREQFQRQKNQPYCELPYQLETGCKP